jgi:hypothetical protein
MVPKLSRAPSLAVAGSLTKPYHANHPVTRDPLPAMLHFEIQSRMFPIQHQQCVGDEYPRTPVLRSASPTTDLPASPLARFEVYGPLPIPQIQLAQRTASDTIIVRVLRRSREETPSRIKEG